MYKGKCKDCNFYKKVDDYSEDFDGNPISRRVCTVWKHTQLPTEPYDTCSRWKIFGEDVYVNLKEILGILRERTNDGLVELVGADILDKAFYVKTCDTCRFHGDDEKCRCSARFTNNRFSCLSWDAKE